MQPTYEYVVVAVITLVAAAAVFAVWVVNRKRIAAETIGRAEEQALRIIKDAERDAEGHKKEALLDAKEKAHEIVIEAERQSRRELQQNQALEQALVRREAQAAERQSSIERREKELDSRESAVAAREKHADSVQTKLDQLVTRQQRELERVASLTAEEAKELLIKHIEADARHDAANLLKRLDSEARETAADLAKHYITEAIQRSAAEHAIETTVSVVDLPSDDLKGRIIGREGRNIRALELATGVDLIVDDTPGAIILSGFDPYRREIAKKAIERLIADGRIHPARIEEVVQKVKDETDEQVRKEGASVAFELGLHDLHPEILRLMGRLKFRTSYGQNVLSHSAEVARLAGIMAREIGLDAHVAVRAAFLHDIGKAIDRDMQGTHLELGIDFLRKHGENEAVVMAMAAHHMDIDWPSLEAMIVQAADAISAARPGARRDILESYVKRLEKLEGIADSFKGVSKAFALQAGREIRIMVESEKISDEEAVWLSKDIARRIENELEYPGQIKVTVIRETRAVDYAK
ncbi:MAG: ribonuclease Y [Acidobacteria bacterium]|nr:MAG: ribonuclease Y [Acidobacteriota bacterium]PYR48958.1 MAG: ribonuclease Y [Acidobacteriota bacterium]